MLAEQPCRAVPLVVPAWIVRYWVQADPFDRNAGLPRLRHFIPDDPEPGRPHIAFDAGPLVTIVDVGKQLAQWAVIGMVHRHRQISVDPLIMQIVVDADNVDVVRPAPQLRPGAPGEVIERLELRPGVLARRLYVLPLVRAWDDLDCWLGVNNAGSGVYASHALDGSRPRITPGPR